MIMVCGGMTTTTTRAMANVQRPTAQLALEEFQENGHDEMDHHHAIFYCECEDVCAPFPDETDPIMIRFAEELSAKMGTMPHAFRLPSKSLGEHMMPLSPASNAGSCKARRACSEGSLALLVPTDASGCPCETVQGIHSHQSCPAMDDMMPDTSCFTCGSDWLLDHTALACFECGGWGLVRPCGQCSGKCGQDWKRDLNLTHTTGEASWAGQCSLDKENSMRTPR